ncbi:hypothetical protein A0H81_06872 [Grifola frondosa]|uniref:Uncharacterized protein n=1 Tax=Grifola frondosa TaxID=5627 RepID=A0A1C7MA53_GRIFR|nr:hypothetical protein A0H81_06872 [Grifola frondosa]
MCVGCLILLFTGTRPRICPPASILTCQCILAFGVLSSTGQLILRGSGSQDVMVLVQSLEMFCRERLLFWIEALSIMDRLDVAVMMALTSARDWRANSSTQDHTYF